FRAAPVDRRIMAWEQLESAWPVHGSVLVHDGVIYCTAGRLMFLDGGIRFLKLDPETGRLLGEVIMDDKDPETGEEIHLAYLKRTPGNTMPVALNDVLSCDGRFIWLRSQKIDFDGKRLEIEVKDVREQTPEDCHLFCQAGLLDDSYFFRTYWTYGRRMIGGYGGWLRAGRLVPSGRILCVDDTHVYGFGRKPEFMVNSSVIQYEIFCADKAVTQEAIDRVTQASRAINRRSPRRNGDSSDWLLRHFFSRKNLSAVNVTWVKEQPAVIARALALSGDAVLLAGPPNFIDERQAYRLPDDPDVLAKLQRQDEAFQGRHGGELWVLAKADGTLRARYALDTVPVFDGMAVAGGRVYVSTVDGRVLCLSGPGRTALKKVTDRPVHVVWDQPEDPSYLLPPEKPKNDDFDRVIRCRVVECRLGYRVIAQSPRRPGIALKRLKKPVTGRVTFQARVSVPKDTRGLLHNGFLVFGEVAKDEQLVKCGVRLQAKNVSIVQGAFQGGKSRSAGLQAQYGQVLDLLVTVDLPKRQIVCTVGDVTVKAPLQLPMDQIRFVGYAVDSALADFTPIQVQTP
ncbi:MAG TPA: hypothetical protein EYP14_20730, partial [Planctomycetaceae bacterium]|nr:hypothetical protein [Planctomycetaceae bacterium]